MKVIELFEIRLPILVAPKLRGPGTNLFQPASKLLRFTLQRANRICLEDIRVPVPKEIYAQSLDRVRSGIDCGSKVDVARHQLIQLSIPASSREAYRVRSVIRQSLPRRIIGWTSFLKVRQQGPSGTIMESVIEGFGAMIFDAVAVVPWRYPKLVFIEINGIAQTVLKAWRPVQIANAIKYQGQLLLSNLRRQGGRSHAQHYQSFLEEFVDALHPRGLYKSVDSVRWDADSCDRPCHFVISMAARKETILRRAPASFVLVLINSTVNPHFRMRSSTQAQQPVISRLTGGGPTGDRVALQEYSGRSKDRDPPKVAKIENVMRVEPALKAGRKLCMALRPRRALWPSATSCGRFDSNESKGAVAESNGTMDMVLRPRATALQPAGLESHYGQRKSWQRPPENKGVMFPVLYARNEPEAQVFHSTSSPGMSWLGFSLGESFSNGGAAAVLGVRRNCGGSLGLLHVIQPCAFILPPFAIHSVILFSTSSHTGTYFAYSAHWAQARLGLDFAKALVRNPAFGDIKASVLIKDVLKQEQFWVKAMDGGG
ncbi:hypothetical protein B0H13DRAFT_1859294 [Mycena leptocephala]|nr:hypothetical protein B0H13DRAFT_1859294 [Mycena leptocephala]